MPKPICEMAMLIRAEVAREDLEVKNPELLLAPSSFKQCVEPILVVAGRIGSYDCVAAEQSVEPITDLFNSFPFPLHDLERNAVHRFR